LTPASNLSRQLLKTFGPRILTGDEINRSRLADIVFSDPEALQKLEQITHPAVVARVLHEVAQTGASLIVVEAVKLIQSGLADHVDSLWFVTAEPEVRRLRLEETRGLSAPAALARMAASDSVMPSCVQPDVVIDNSGSRMSTQAATYEALHRLLDGNMVRTESERSEH
jgi:dephospho-CoA kinase